METQVLERRVDVKSVAVRSYREGDQQMLVDLINETDQVDRFDVSTTLDEVQHDWDDPHFIPERDGFVAVVWKNGRPQAVASGEVLLPAVGPSNEDTTVFCWHLVRPEWRGTGLGSQILEACYARATAMVADVDDPRAKLFRVHINAGDRSGKRRLARFGMQRVRRFYRMEYAPLDGTLPAPDVPSGLRIVAWTPKYDQAVLDAFNEAFEDHWRSHKFSQEEWQHLFHGPYSRPDLWRIAVDDDAGEVAGICIVAFDPEKNEAFGRQEGWIRELGVRRLWRKRGLGTALLLSGMAALQEAGITSVRLGVDSDSLTNATRLYTRAGYEVVSEWLAYLKAIER